MLRDDLKVTLEVLPLHVTCGRYGIVLVISKPDVKVRKVGMSISVALASEKSRIILVDVTASPWFDNLLEFFKIICWHQDVRGTCIYYGLVSVQIKGIVSKLGFSNPDRPIVIVLQLNPTQLAIRLSILLQVIISEYDFGLFICSSQSKREDSLIDNSTSHKSVYEEFRVSILT